MITARKAADQLGMSVRFVYGLGESGALTKYKFGKGVRFDENEVAAYKESCKCQSVSTSPRAAGDFTLTVRLPGERESALAAYFRKAGIKISEKSSTKPRRRAYTPLQLREIEQLRGENAVLAGILSDCDNVLATIVADDIDEAKKIGDLRMALAYALDPYKREGTLL